MMAVIDRLGGEAVVRRLVERFYDLVEELPEGRQIVHLHFRGHGLAHVRAAQFEFLCAFFGGRRDYLERPGALNLKEMHTHVPIRPEDARDWLFCMGRAMEDTGVAEPLRGQIFRAFERAALALVNREAGAVAE
jgi:hemoglobin